MHGIADAFAILYPSTACCWAKVRSYPNVIRTCAQMIKMAGIKEHLIALSRDNGLDGSGRGLTHFMLTCSLAPLKKVDDTDWWREAVDTDFRS